MQSGDGNFQFGRQFEIPDTGPEIIYPVGAVKWGRMIDRIEMAENNSCFYGSAAWTLVGVSASSFISAIALPHTTANIPVYVKAICWSVFVVSFIVAITTFHFSSVHNDDREEMRKQVVQDMKDIRRRHSQQKSDGNEV